MSSVLFVAHPGHEIRLHHWLELEKPAVFVLTDGSGGNSVSRLASTERVLEACGAPAGSLMGHYTDRQLYQLIRDQRIDEILALGETLEKSWRDLGVTNVTADMMEGFNTAHDLVRFLCGAVLERLRRREGRVITNWDFPLEGRPDRMLDCGDSTDVLELNEDAFRRKLQAARHYEELRGEVEHALQSWGTAAFQREVRRLAPQPAGMDWTEAEPPYYETYGARMVAQGRYKELITYRQHMQPIANALWNWAVGKA